MDEEQTKTYNELLRRVKSARESQASKLYLGDLDLDFLTQIPLELATLPLLRSLILPAWQTLIDLTQLASLSALQSLDLAGCNQISNLTPLASLSALQSLDLFLCNKISDLTPLTCLSALQSLNLTACKQINDLSPLTSLSDLQSLNLSECNQINDLTPLACLSALQSLDLSGCEQIGDLTPLASLSDLQSLDLSGCYKISDLTPLASHSALQSLNLTGCKQISDLTPLASLSALQSLNLTGCNHISDLTPLASLSALESLDLSRCYQISDLTPLAFLSGLRSLNLFRCERISDLTPLASLSALQSLTLNGCDQVSNLTALASLSALQSLGLSACEQISDVKPLASLSALRSLDLSWCEQINDLNPIASLSNLHRLYLAGLINLQFSSLTSFLPNLTELILYKCQLADLPIELCGGSFDENVLPKVRAHYADLQPGFAPNNELKALFLGNGGVGKSQLCRRLQDLPYDPKVATTHGVKTTQKTLSLGLETPVTLNLWDFGGQEIYHGSHSLFLQGQSIFLILWTPEKENTPPYEENGIVMRNRALPYWLDYVRCFAGANIPLLIVQSQCDTAAQRVPQPPGLSNLNDFPGLHVAYVSAKTGIGLDLVNASLKEAVRYSLELRPSPPIGLGRIRVRDRLRTILADGHHRWLERTHFNQICQEEGGISDTEALLDFFHHSGVIFYRPGLFSGRIILDQNWALEAIYTLFDRKKTLPLLHGHGSFNRNDLEILAWSQYARDEQLVFLDMMQSCGICFKTRHLGNDEWEYLAPELLPPWSEAQETLLTGRLLTDPASAEVTAQYAFLHDGVLRNSLSRIGEKAGGNAIYWKYGCWFYEQTTNCRVLIDSQWHNTQTETGPGSIRFRAWGSQAQNLIKPLVEELQKTPMGRAPEFHWKESPSVDTKPTALKDLEPATAVQPAAGAPTLYISYAWGFDQIVDGLCTALANEGWNIIRDKTSMKYGDLITDFMKTLTQADRIIIVFSAKNLRSEFCMTELHGIYQRAAAEKQDFLTRVIPLSLEDAKFSHWRDRTEIAKHWRTEYEEMEKSVRDLGASDLCLYKAMQDWANRVSDMLKYIDDKLHPHGYEAIAQNNFTALKEMLGPLDPTAAIPPKQHAAKSHSPG